MAGVIAVGGQQAASTPAQAATAQHSTNPTTPGQLRHKLTRKTLVIALSGLGVIGVSTLAIAAGMSLGHKDSPAQLPLAPPRPSSPSPPRRSRCLTRLTNQKEYSFD